MVSSVKNSGHSSNRSSSRQATYAAYSSSISRRSWRRLSVRKFSLAAMRPPSQLHHPAIIVVKRSDRALGDHVGLRLLPVATAHLHDTMPFGVLPEAILREFDDLTVVERDKPRRAH